MKWNLKEKGRKSYNTYEYGPDGVWEYYYENGNLKEKGAYIYISYTGPDGEKHLSKDKVWEYFSNDGKLIKKDIYENGEIIK